MKKDLDRIFKANGTTGNPEFSMSQERRSSRGHPAKGTTYDRICIFCNKESKYGKGKQTREKLIQCFDLRSDQMIRDVATAKHDTNILVLASRELVAGEACYHKSCYRNYTRPTGERASGKPFSGRHARLICLSTGKMASEDVAGDLLQAKHLGERAFQSFSKERLEANPPKVRFHDSMSNAMLKTFKHMNKKVELRKGTAKEIVLKADRALFAHMIVIAEARQLSMKEVLSHPLGPLPWSLAAPDGSLKKTAKSSLAMLRQLKVFYLGPLALSMAWQWFKSLKGIKKRLKKLQRCYWPWRLREGGSSTSIDVVFDNYREMSIKNLEREKRGAEMGATYRSIRPDYRSQK